MLSIKNCRSCSSESLHIVWHLANCPYGDLFKSNRQAAFNEESHSMTLALCSRCTLVQLLEETNLETQYDEYLYTSSVTHGLGMFYSQVTKRLISDFLFDSSDLVLDIGSNDGSFLINFKHFEVIGVEPARSSYQIATSKGVPTINKYFGTEVVTEILSTLKKPKLISVNYTLANVPNVRLFMEQIVRLMDDSTILSVITGYHPDQFSINMFDYIGHDHLSYFSVESLRILCELLGLKIVDVSRVEHKGGSIHLLITRKNSDQIVQPSVWQIVQREKWMQTEQEIFYKALKLRIEVAGEEVKLILKSLGKIQLCGIGASISTTYLSNQLGISSQISNLYDDDKNKIGKFSPGSGIEVKPLASLPLSKDFVPLILAWQHTEKLLSRLKEIGFSGPVLVPLPRPQLIVI